MTDIGIKIFLSSTQKNKSKHNYNLKLSSNLKIVREEAVEHLLTCLFDALHSCVRFGEKRVKIAEIETQERVGKNEKSSSRRKERFVPCENCGE